MLVLKDQRRLINARRASVKIDIEPIKAAESWFPAMIVTAAAVSRAMRVRKPLNCLIAELGGDARS